MAVFVRHPVVIVMFFTILTLVPHASGIEYIYHDIKIVLEHNLDTQITETYQIKLNDTEKDHFSKIMVSPTLQDLVDFGIGPSFKIDVKDLHVSYTLGEAGFAQVTIQYKSPDLMKRLETTGNMEIVGITEDTMVFYDGSKVVFPFRPTTQLTVQFPETLKLAEQPQPLPTEERLLASIPEFEGQFYEYQWKGPFSSDRFRLVFEVEKPIQTQLSMANVLEEIRKRFGNPFYIIVFVIIVALLYIYRGFILNLLKDAFGEEPVLEEE